MRPISLEVGGSFQGPGKPSGINRFIARRPILAFGNSDGDRQMLEVTAAGGTPHLSGLLHHTDATREWAYDRTSKVGQLDTALDEANRKGWIVADMKRNWRLVFAFQGRPARDQWIARSGLRTIARNSPSRAAPRWNAGRPMMKLWSWTKFAAVCSVVLIAMPAVLPAQTAPATQAQAPGQGNAVNAANNPLTPVLTVNLQDYFMPSLNRLGNRTANQFLLRGLVPAKLFGVPQIVRFTLPLATEPSFPSGSDTGLGDLTLFDLAVVPWKSALFGVGPVLVAPTASSRNLGAGKWQAGVAGVVVLPEKWGLFATLVTYQHSFAGDSSRSRTSLMTVQPVVTYNLPEKFYLRSSGVWNFDFVNHTDFIPIGLGIGRVWSLPGGTTINAFIEPQYSVVRSGIGVPKWQIFGGVNLQFPL